MFIEIIVLLIATGAIGTFARGKKISPNLAVGSAVNGYLIIRIAGLLLPGGEGQAYVFFFNAWLWMALVAGYLRFIVGAGRPKPDTQWSCSNCHYLNNASSLFCEACQQPWMSPDVSPQES